MTGIEYTIGVHPSYFYVKSAPQLTHLVSSGLFLAPQNLHNIASGTVPLGGTGVWSLLMFCLIILYAFSASVFGKLFKERGSPPDLSVHLIVERTIPLSMVTLAISL